MLHKLTQIWRTFVAIWETKNYNDQDAVWSSTLVSDPITLDPVFNVLIKGYFEMVIKDSEMNDQ